MLTFLLAEVFAECKRRSGQDARKTKAKLDRGKTSKIFLALLLTKFYRFLSYAQKTFNVWINSTFKYDIFKIGFCVFWFGCEILQEFFSGGGNSLVPEVQGWLYVKGDSKSWNKKYCVLRSSGLYVNKGGEPKKGKKVKLLFFNLD